MRALSAQKRRFRHVLVGFHFARQGITGISLPLFAGLKEVSAFRQFVVANDLQSRQPLGTKIKAPLLLSLSFL